MWSSGAQEGPVAPPWLSFYFTFVTVTGTLAVNSFFASSHAVEHRDLPVAEMWHTRAAGGGGALQASCDKRRHRNCFQTLYQVSQAQTVGWVKRNNKKDPELVPARLGAVKLHFRCCRNILDFGLVTRLCLTVSPVRSYNSRSVYATNQRHDLWQWWNGKTIEALAGRRPTARWLCLRKFKFLCDYPCSRNRESNFFLTDLPTFFLFSSSVNCLKNVATDFLFLSND